MSTRFDILGTKAEFEEHVSSHHCRTGECPERLTRWNAYIGTAARWATEPGDDERQRQQFTSQQGDSRP
jgi:hypothetical protein